MSDIATIASQYYDRFQGLKAQGLTDSEAIEKVGKDAYVKHGKKAQAIILSMMTEFVAVSDFEAKVPNTVKKHVANAKKALKEGKEPSPKDLPYYQAVESGNEDLALAKARAEMRAHLIHSLTKNKRSKVMGYLSKKLTKVKAIATGTMPFADYAKELEPHYEDIWNDIQSFFDAYTTRNKMTHEPETVKILLDDAKVPEWQQIMLAVT